MISPKHDVQQRPKTSTHPAGGNSTEDMKFHSGRVAWLVANLLLGAESEDILRAMTDAGFSEAYALARLSEFEQNVTVVSARKTLAVQRITTKQCSEDQVECAIKALDEAMNLEKTHGGELVIA